MPAIKSILISLILFVLVSAFIVESEKESFKNAFTTNTGITIEQFQQKILK